MKRKRLGWFLPRDRLTDLAAKSLDKLIEDTQQAHITDVIMRLGGKDVRREADWIKYLEQVTYDKP